MIKRDSEGVARVYRQTKDDWVPLDSVLLAILGYAYSSGYLGSSLFLELEWKNKDLKELPHVFKVRAIQDFEILEDNENLLVLEVGDFRTVLAEEGMLYEPYSIRVPKFLFTGKRDEIKNFLKGYVLGYYTNELVTEFETEETITLRVKGIVLWEDLQRLCSEGNIPYVATEAGYRITFTDKEMNRWFLEQRNFS